MKEINNNYFGDIKESYISCVDRSVGGLKLRSRKTLNKIAFAMLDSGKAKGNVC